MSEITEIKTLNGYPLADTKAREDIATLSEEIADIKGGKKETTFEETGEFVRFTPKEGSAVGVISSFSGHYATWKWLYLHHINSKNICNLASMIGKPGDVITKNGLTATLNADSTVTITGTNDSTGYTNILQVTDVAPNMDYVYPAGTYTVGSRITLMLKTVDWASGANKKGTFTMDYPFRIRGFYVDYAGGATANDTIPLCLVRGNTLPDGDYAYSGTIYKATFSKAYTEGTFDWGEGKLYDASGNLLETTDAVEITGLSGENSMWIGNGTVTATGVAITGESVTVDELVAAAMQKVNVLYGKKYVACGDSFTAGDFTGYVDENGLSGRNSPVLYDSDLKMYKTYPWWIAKRNNMTLVLDAQNGTTMALDKTYVADPGNVDINTRNPFSNERYKQIPSDADYITIWFGLNDANGNTNLGTIDDVDNTTFYGAWNVVLEYLLVNHPYAKVGIVVTDGIVDSPYQDAVREVAKKWGFPYLDLVGDTQIPAMIYGRDSDLELCDRAKELRNAAFMVTASNFHPGIKAHEYRSTIVENWLRTL